MKIVKNILIFVAGMLAGAFALLLAAGSFRASAATEATVLVGDVNKDGVIGTDDVYQLLLLYSRSAAGDDSVVIDIALCDTDHDRQLTTNDAWEALKYYSLITAGSDTAEWPPTPRKYFEEDTVTYTGEMKWNLRLAPELDDSNIVLQLEKGDTMEVEEVIDTDADWYKVKYQGISLYVQITAHEFFRV